jgi:hypothetical protein
MPCHHRTIQILLTASIGTLFPAVAIAQSPDSVPQRRSQPAQMDSTGFDLAMGFHHGEPAEWSVALGAERYRRGVFHHSTFLLLEPGKRADRVSLGTGTSTGDDLGTALATNIRASYLRIRRPRPQAAVGNYGGVEAQVLFLGLGARVGVFKSSVTRKPIETLDLSLAF